MCGNINPRQINAIIDLDPTRLDRPLRPLFTRQFHSFVAELRGVPSDCDAVVVRIFRAGNNGFFDIPATISPSGTMAYIIGTCFDLVGDGRYEIHATDAEGNRTALGVGLVHTQSFSVAGEPLEPGEERPIMEIFDKSGAKHTITAVFDGDNWTSVLDDDWSVGNE